MKQQTITNYVNALNEANTFIKAKQWDSNARNQITKKHHIPVSFVGCAVEVGLFERIGYGEYKSKIEKIDPIHARKVIDQFNKNAKENKKKRVSKVTVVPKKINGNPVNRKNPRLSLFWGLIIIY